MLSTHVLAAFAPATAIVSTNAVMLLTHFSREGFFFISACMLTYAYMDLDRGGLRRFYGRRLVAVTVPYVCWTVIYFLYLLPSMHYTSAAAALEHFAKLIATGYYQLYFLLIIMQFYLAFPLFLRFLRRTRKHHWRPTDFEDTFIMPLLALSCQIDPHIPQVRGNPIHAVSGSGCSTLRCIRTRRSSHGLRLSTGAGV